MYGTHNPATSLWWQQLPAIADGVLPYASFKYCYATTMALLAIVGYFIFKF